MPQTRPTTGRPRAIFGPLLYGTIAIAALALVGHAIWQAWPSLRLRWEVRTLAGQLKDPDPIVSRSAAIRMARIGPTAVHSLMAATIDEDVGVRRLAFSALGRTMPVPMIAIPAVIAGLRDPDPQVRRITADTLARFGPEARDAIDPLARVLDDRIADVRFRAARTLYRIEGQAHDTALNALISLVASPGVTNRPNSIGAVPPKVDALGEVAPVSDALPPDRAAVVEVIRKLGDGAASRAIAALIPLVAADDPKVRREAVECLGLFGPKARTAVPSLENALGNEDLVVRCLAALSLSEIEGWEKGRARSMLETLVDHPKLPTRARKQVPWVVQANLVAGSEISQPVHVLRDLVDEVRRAEEKAKLDSIREPEPDVSGPE
jgi:HEAT repeat protein